MQRQPSCLDGFLPTSFMTSDLCWPLTPIPGCASARRQPSRSNTSFRCSTRRPTSSHAPANSRPKSLVAPKTATAAAPRNQPSCRLPRSNLLLMPSKPNQPPLPNQPLMPILPPHLPPQPRRTDRVTTPWPLRRRKRRARRRRHTTMAAASTTR